MYPRLVGRILCTVFLSLLCFPLPFFWKINTTHAAQTILIGEVNWAGSSLSSADEWLELWNNSDKPLWLSGYILRGAASTDITFTDMHSIPPKSAFIISNYADADPKCAIATTTQLITTAVSLSNNNLKIELIAPDGTLIDTAGNNEAPPSGSSLPVKASMIRTSNESWASATTSINLDSNITDFATPGLCDGCTTITLSDAVTNEENTPIEPILEPIANPEPELPIIEIPTSTEPISETETSESSQLNEANSTMNTHEETVSTSSTEMLLEIKNTSTTTTVLEPLVGTSSTKTIYSTSTLELPIVITTNIITSNISNAILPKNTYAPINIYLHTISPAPESGEEWIEVNVPSETVLAQANNWSLRDATGTIFRFTSSSTQITVTNTIWRIKLASARLNNSGDTVELVRPDGTIAERMKYPETPKGTIWMKNTNQTGWMQNPLPTSLIQEMPDTSQSTDEAITHDPTIELPIIHAQEKAQQENEILTESLIPQQINNDQQLKISKPKKTNTATNKQKTKQKSKPTKNKINKKQKDSTPPMATLDMLTKLDPEIRVSLEGIVGTIPGILAKNQFTIHAPDGRGLRVRGNNKQPSPNFGSQIKITGTLSLNDDGLVLRMQSKDSWEEITKKETVSTRVIDLIAPSQEDAWSLIQVTGTVIETTNNKIYLELNGIPLTVNLKPAIKFRAKRLSQGDKIRVTGIIDTRNDELTIFPRKTDEIEIIEHAKLAKNKEKVNEWPTWTPFGAAGITVAISEGYKRLRRIAKERKLKKMAALAQ